MLDTVAKKKRPLGTGLPADHPNLSEKALAREKRTGKFKLIKLIGPNDHKNFLTRKRNAEKKRREKKLSDGCCKKEKAVKKHK
jgi:hypothetical protein